MFVTSKPLTRARPVSSERAQVVDEHVMAIATLMGRGAWSSPGSLREYAKTAGVGVESVKDWATDAGRFLRLSMRADKETLVARNAARLDYAVERAFALDEPRQAVSAIEAQNKLLGLNAPERHEHAHVVAQFEQLPVAAKREKLLEARAKIDAALAALDAEVVDAGT